MEHDVASWVAEEARRGGARDAASTITIGGAPAWTAEQQQRHPFSSAATPHGAGFPHGLQPHGIPATPLTPAATGIDRGVGNLGNLGTEVFLRRARDTGGGRHEMSSSSAIVNDGHARCSDAIPFSRPV